MIYIIFILMFNIVYTTLCSMFLSKSWHSSICFCFCLFDCDIVENRSQFLPNKVRHSAFHLCSSWCHTLGMTYGAVDRNPPFTDEPPTISDLELEAVQVSNIVLHSNLTLSINFLSLLPKFYIHFPEYFVDGNLIFLIICLFVKLIFCIFPFRFLLTRPWDLS